MRDDARHRVRQCTRKPSSPQGSLAPPTFVANRLGVRVLEQEFAAVRRYAVAGGSPLTFGHVGCSVPIVQALLEPIGYALLYRLDLLGRF